MNLIISFFIIILIYGFIVWLLKKWNDEPILKRESDRIGIKGKKLPLP